jgi:acyl-CoA reductase-like NAD-dependent aldehyde dehydrogenase
VRQGRNFIGGSFVPAASGRTFRRENPSRVSEVVGEAPDSGPEDVAAAVAAAKAALPGWRRLPAPTRGRHLLAAAAALEAAAADLAALVVDEVGKPVGEARAEVARAVALLRYYAAETERAIGENLPHPDGRSLLLTRRVPLGVVGLITPWNFPVAIPVWKAAPALAFGNTVVWKPAMWASLVAHRLAEILAGALPAGVFNLVTGSGRVAGEALVGHPDVAAVSFTGSVETGRRMAVSLAGRGVKFQAEMGGKNPVIVLADADLERAVEVTSSGAFRFAGQKCTATSRVIVEQAVAGRFVEMLAERARSLRPSMPVEETCYLGPVVSREQLEGIRAAMAQARADGARLLAGGPEPVAGLEQGYFLSPTVFDRVAPGSALAQEEIFGPVLAVLTARDAEEALRLANDTRYGLSASLFTTSLDRVFQYLDGIEAGMVRVNAETTGVDYLAPFGGMKASSSHSREQGRAAIEFYTELQTVTISPPR